LGVADLPGAWVPHVSLALNATDTAAQAATATPLAHWAPMTVRISGIRPIQFALAHSLVPLYSLYRRTLALR
jgi:hypothetical protein